MLTKMRLELGPWVARRAPRKETTTELASLATLHATVTVAVTVTVVVMAVEAE